jgi:hypothetical protein
MKKINFIKKVTPLSADTFNQMQNNIEEEFNQVDSQLAQKASQQEVNNTFNQMQNNIEEEFSKVNSQLSDIAIVLSGINDGEDITNKLHLAIDNAISGSTIKIPKGTYLYNKSKVITKPINIISDGATLKTTTNNFDVFFSFQNINNFFIQGIIFDNNLKGRTCIDVINCNDFEISKCFFTGYSAEYGYYHTDSAIRVSGSSKNVRIFNNTFVNWGSQYDNATETLNRCITINDTVERVFIDNNVFREVNQAIVTVGKNVLITNNIFDGVKDNCVYGGYKNMVISNNYIRNGYDEGLVVQGDNVIISNNVIVDCPNKAIAINNPIKNLTIIGNIIDNSNITKGQFIYYRDFSITVENCLITDNQFTQPNQVNNYSYFAFGHVTNLKFKDNVINAKFLNTQKIIQIAGNTTGEIANNRFIGVADSDVSAFTVFVEAGYTYDVIYEDNEHINCRGTQGGLILKNQIVQTNVGPYSQNRNKNSVVWSDSAPARGSWQKGDICYNTNPVAGGYLGWVCVSAGTPGTWKTFGVISS